MTKSKRIQKKFQVFISSTFDDLKNERLAAIDAIVKEGHMPLALEHFPPQNASVNSVIKGCVSACQFYVIILGHRYGSKPKDESCSYTELELNLAESKKLEILSFVLDEQVAIEKRKQLDRRIVKDKNELDNDKQYWELRKRLENNKFTKPYSDEQNIREDLRVLFAQEHKEVRGFILEPMDRDDAEILKIYSSSKIVRDVFKALNSYDVVESRTNIAIEKKDAMAKAFVELHGMDIQKGRINELFLESGSTIAAVARELSTTIKEGRVRNQEITIKTNNAFAYLYLWLCCRVACEAFPHDPPAKPYGIMYGDLNVDRSPTYEIPLEDYDKDSYDTIKDMSKRLFTNIENDPKKHKSIILAAYSGLQLSSYDDVLGKEQDLNLYGFNVNSYVNHLFKRCLYLTGKPTIVMIHDDKIDVPIKLGKTHIQCDKKVPWSEMISEHPLSIWVACDSDSYVNVRDKIGTYFTEGDWEISTYAKTCKNPIVICHNKVFRNMLREMEIEPFIKNSKCQ